MSKTLKEISEETPTLHPLQLIEEKGEAVSPNDILPGHLYGLGVLPSNNENRKLYSDTIPIGMALYINTEDKSSISFLNLKVPDVGYRNLILGEYFYRMGIQHELITKFYNEDLTEFDKPFKERLVESSYIDPFMAVTQSFITEVVGGNNISFAVSTYKKNDIKRVRFLDWDALPYLFKMGVMDTGMTFGKGVGGLAALHTTFRSKFTSV